MGIADDLGAPAHHVIHTKDKPIKEGGTPPSKSVEDLIVTLAKKYPAWSAERLARALEREDVVVTSDQVRQVLKSWERTGGKR